MTNQAITLPDWYQIDFKIEKSVRVIIQKVANLAKELKSKSLIKKWFYLYENTTVRVRFKSKKPRELERAIDNFAKTQKLIISEALKFGPYWESTGIFPDIQTLKGFANIMSELSELTIAKAEGQVKFSNYILTERLSHCIFNNIYGTDTEAYFLLKRLGVSFGHDDNPEQTILDDKMAIKLIQNCSVNLTGIKVPVKGDV